MPRSCRGLFQLNGTQLAGMEDIAAGVNAAFCCFLFF
jgi:hypothetical protein